MTIFRVQHNRNFTSVNNYITRDNRLSWKAKGIWLYAFSRPDIWQFHLNDLVKQSTDGKDSVSAGLKELETCGYLIRTRIRKKDGTLGAAEWVFHELPITDKNPSTNIPEPKPENPILDNPILDNPPLVNTDPILSTEKSKYSRAKAGAKKKEEAPKTAFREAVSLTENEFVELTNLHGVENLQWMFDKLNAWKLATGTIYKSDAATMRKGGWVLKALQEERDKKKNAQPKETNRAIVEKRGFKNSHAYKGYECNITDSAVSFTAIRGQNHRQLSFSEKGFADQFENMLRSLGILNLI